MSKARLTALVVAAAVALPAAAEGASITFICDFNVCRVSPDGGKVRKITRDGTVDDSYYETQNVRDSSLIAFSISGRGTWLARRDGSRRELVGYSSHLSTDARGAGWFPGGGSGSWCWYRRVAPRRTVRCGPRGFYWWKSRRAYGFDEVSGFAEHPLCLLAPRDLECARVVARPPRGGGQLLGVDVSPDGRLALTTQEVERRDGGTGYRVILFRTRTGRVIRFVSRGGHHDEDASFSPDGRMIVFGRDDETEWSPQGPQGQICVTRTSGGRTRCVARGKSPSWTR